jgi:hypothetical protein
VPERKLGPDLVVVLHERLRREHVRSREIGGVTEPEALACRLVQELDTTLLVDDADEIRRGLHERQQLVRDIPVRSDLTHDQVLQTAFCWRFVAQFGTVEFLAAARSSPLSAGRMKPFATAEVSAFFHFATKSACVG